jgi:hypothetical protein
MAYASELDMDVRLLWVHAFVLWLEHEPVLGKESQEQIGPRSSAGRSRRRVDRAGSLGSSQAGSRRDYHWFRRSAIWAR